MDGGYRKMDSLPEKPLSEWHKMLGFKKEIE